MKLLRVIRTILLCVVSALPLAAHADLYGSTTLDISRIALKHANGTLFSPADFSQATVQYQGRLISLTGDTLESSEQALTPNTLHLPRLCNGAACPITDENNFEPISATPAGLFANADQMQSGSLLAGNLRMQLRSDAGARRLGGPAYADAVSVVQFQFTPTQAGAMTIEFDATPFVTLSLPHASRLPGDVIDIGLHLSLSISNLTTNESILFAIPEAISSASRLQLDGSSTFENLIYNPGTMAFSFSSLALNADDTYEFSIAASSFVWTTPVPEPSSLAMFGAGLVSLLILGRRKRVAPRTVPGHLPLQAPT